MSIFTLKSTKKASFSSILAIFALFFIIATQMGCSKSENSTACPVAPVSTKSEDEQISTYLTTNNISFIKDTKGFYYQIVKPGNTNKPNLSSSITIDYIGTFLNKNEFERANNQTFNLGQLIYGWQFGLPLIGEGGEINLFLPSSFAYGSTGSGCIPASTPLIFNVKLTAVK